MVVIVTEKLIYEKLEIMIDEKIGLICFFTFISIKQLVSCFLLAMIKDRWLYKN